MSVPNRARLMIISSGPNYSSPSLGDLVCKYCYDFDDNDE